MTKIFTYISGDIVRDISANGPATVYRLVIE